MNADQRAALVAEIAKHYAFRDRHGIPHTSHTVRRLLQAVSDLIGHRVVIQKEPTI